MRLFSSIVVVAVSAVLGSTSASANHRIESVAGDYHETVHTLADYVSRDHRVSPYLVRYFDLLDHAADDFLAAVVHDPYCPRTLAMFEELQSLHRRVASLLGHGCRTLPAVASTWAEADYLFVQLDRVYGPRCSHRDQSVVVRRIPVVVDSTPSYPKHGFETRLDARFETRLDRRRSDFQQRDYRNLNNGNVRTEPVPQASRSRGIERLLMGLLN
ncbi:MAG: hypothetical protein R3C05_09495 [Pirellulaceae bacterium]